MKNQYFGDIRDLFKWDLIEHILATVSAFRRSLTYIPMLTPDGGNHGNLVDYDDAVGCKNGPLRRYLGQCVESGKRDINLIVPYYEKRGVTAHLHRGEGEFFNHHDRGAHFGGVVDSLLDRALIFLDPDNGLEIQYPTEAHLLYADVGGLYDRMGEDAASMVFQYFPHERRAPYIARRCQELEDHTGGTPLAIWSSQLSFLFVARNEDLAGELRRTLGAYKAQYDGHLSVGP